MKSLELVGEHWKDNLIGETLTQRLSGAIQEKYSRELQAIRLENNLRDLRKGKLRQNLSEAVSVSILNKGRKILDIGFNDPDDLMLDNLGVLFAAMLFSPTNSGTRTMTLKDLGGSNNGAFNTYGVGSYSCWNGATTNTGGQGTKFQIGSGTTAAARADYKIQTAFATSPESGDFSPVAGAYQAGTGVINLAACVTAGGSGTVNEVLMKGYFSQNGMNNTYDTFALFHDILASGVSFSPGNIINVVYTFNI